MRETVLRESLAACRRRLVAVALAVASVLASAMAALVAVALLAAGASTAAARLTAVVAFVAVLAWQASRASRLTLLDAAGRLDRATRADNIVVTAAAIANGRLSPPHDVVYDELLRAATDAVHAVRLSTVIPLVRPIAAGSAALVATVAVLITAPGSELLTTRGVPATAGTPPAAAGPGDLRVVITPPDYTGRPVEEIVNPTRLNAIEGSTVRMESATPATLLDADGTRRGFAAETSGFSIALTATRSRPLLVRRGDSDAGDRLLHLHVQRDARPVVDVRRPARDLMFDAPEGSIPVHVTAEDDLALSSLTLHYTKVSGSGESFTFEEGEWPLQVTREAAGAWSGAATLDLSRLELQDGDTLVYRAVARDAKPGANPSSSPTYLVEIGRLSGIASTGFALPDARDRQALSQQMLIIKTERLHAQRGALTAEAFTEQAQLLAVEQRMVKAEFVFMTGGHVVDEVEEAAHSHELAEGRLENAATVELLAAIREMSRAEQRLNAAETGEALVLERAALRALQRAFDRRRYLLRTLPERTRIDASRRLTGERDTARSSQAARVAPAVDPVLQRAREVLHDMQMPSDRPTEVAARLLAVEPASEVLQKAALRLSSADPAQRAEALRDAQRALLRVIEQRGGALTEVASVPRQPLRGFLAEELAKEPRP